MQAQNQIKVTYFQHGRLHRLMVGITAVEQKLRQVTMTHIKCQMVMEARGCVFLLLGGLLDSVQHDFEEVTDHLVVVKV